MHSSRHLWRLDRATAARDNRRHRHRNRHSFPQPPHTCRSDRNPMAAHCCPRINSATLQCPSDNRGDLDASELPSSCAEMDPIVLQKGAVRGRRVARGGGVAVAAVHHLAVQVVELYVGVLATGPE